MKRRREQASTYAVGSSYGYTNIHLPSLPHLPSSSSQPTPPSPSPSHILPPPYPRSPKTSFLPKTNKPPRLRSFTSKSDRFIDEPNDDDEERTYPREDSRQTPNERRSAQRASRQRNPSPHPSHNLISLPHPHVSPSLPSSPNHPTPPPSLSYSLPYPRFPQKSFIPKKLAPTCQNDQSGINEQIHLDCAVYR